MAEINPEYERGFKDGLKSECLKELKPIMVELAKGCTEAIKGIAPTLIDKAQLTIIPAVNRWIPVEDDLPEKAGNYLCTLYYAIQPYNLFHPEKDTYIRETSVKFFDGKSFISSVIAWMPMPDAYEPPESEVQHEST